MIQMYVYQKSRFLVSGILPNLLTSELQSPNVVILIREVMSGGCSQPRLLQMREVREVQKPRRQLSGLLLCIINHLRVSQINFLFFTIFSPVSTANAY